MSTPVESAAAVDVDIWDPRYWAEPLPYTTMTVSRCGDHFVLIDHDDYAWARQWMWGVKPSKSRHILYAYRVTCRPNGAKYSLYLHVEIMQRSGISCPWDDAVVDHRNGWTMDCRKQNLRWATRSMNRRNINGQMPFDELVI